MDQNKNIYTIMTEQRKTRKENESEKKTMYIKFMSGNHH